VAQQAKCAHIRKIALPASFGHRDEMIRVPERFSAAFAESPFLEELTACGIVELAHVRAQGLRVCAAKRADAAVAFEDFFAEITGLSAKLPFVDAGFAAEGPAAFGDFGAAPSA
jgi:hypothetical protein